MTKGNIIFIIYSLIWLIIIAILNIYSNYRNNEFLTSIIDFIILFLLILYIVITIILSRYIDRIEKKLLSTINQLSEAKKYDQLRIYLQENMTRQLLSRTVIKLKLVLLWIEMILGNDDNAKAMLRKTKWGRVKKIILYYRIIYLLADQDIDKAKYYYKFKQISRKKGEPYISKAKVLDLLMSNDRVSIEDKVTSSFPIVNDLLNRKYEAYFTNK